MPSTAAKQIVNTEASFDVKDVKPDLEYLLLATSNDSTRPHLQVLHVNSERGEVVTTDSHRLHIVRGLPFPQTSTDAETIELLCMSLKLTRAVKLYVEGNEFRFAGSGHEVTIRSVGTDVEFPPYVQVIPAKTNKETMAAGLARHVTAAIGGEPAHCAFFFKDLVWRLNPTYVKAALTGAGKGDVTIHYPNDENAPIGFLFTANGRERFAIVMPMRQ